MARVLLNKDLEQIQEQVQEQGGAPTSAAGWLSSMPVSKKKYAELVKTEFFTGRDVSGNICVLKRWRDSIFEPLRYEICPGYLETKLVGFATLSKEIKSLLKRENFFSEDGAEWFIAIIRSAVALNKAALEQHFKEGKGEFWESDHPLVAFFIPDDDSDIFNSIMYAVENMFPGKKEKVRQFIEKHREDVMTVKAIRKFTVHSF